MTRRTLIRAANAGLAYFGVVFAAGFVLGTLRVLLVVPWLDEFYAVLLELPVILTVSWIACCWLIRRFDVSAAVSARLVMGGLAFASLMFAEIGVSVFGFGRTLSAHWDAYRQLPALIGLAGQIAFAIFPVIQQANGSR
jgi:hypothetical protein